MCGIASFDAQWVNIAGIVANIVGVSIVAFEWRTSIYDGLDKAEFDQQLLSLSSGGDFVTGIEIGPRAQRFAELADHSALAADQTAFATFTANLAIIDSLDRPSRRRTIFSLGFAIILAGAALQLVAAWPC